MNYPSRIGEICNPRGKILSFYFQVNNSAPVLPRFGFSFFQKNGFSSVTLGRHFSSGLQSS
jgi:hypothetical protein